MKITAEQKYIRTSARKLRLVADAVKHLKPSEAVTQLEFVQKRAAEPVRKVLVQAIANATNNFRLSPERLRISEILVNEGPTYKRWQAVSRGRAHSILKRTSHVKVILETKAVSLTKPGVTQASEVATKSTASRSKNQEAKKKTKTAKVEAKKATKTATPSRVSTQKVTSKQTKSANKPQIRQARKGTK